jgi:threonine aldolase
MRTGRPPAPATLALVTMTELPNPLFASDNYAPAHPDVLAALAAANDGPAISYGEDPWTDRLRERIRAEFGADAEAYPVFNGTGANVVAVTALSPRFGGVLAAESAHLATDENAAPQAIGAVHLLTVPAVEGRITMAGLDAVLAGYRPVHSARPAVLTLTEPTELGTLYTLPELTRLAAAAHARGLAVHLDGSRLWNAAAALGCRFSDFAACGIDALSLGATKVGALGAEAVVVLRPELCAGVEDVRKASTQLASKMRYLSAQLLALFDDDLGLRLAERGNHAAARLRRAVETLPGAAFAAPTETNSVFPVLDRTVAARLRETYRFYDWDPAAGSVRWMCPWSATDADVDAFAAAVAEASGAARPE